MATANYVQVGDIINFVNSTGNEIGYHEVIVLGERIAVATMSIPKDEVGTLSLVGIWEMPAVSGTAFAVGDLLYFNTSTKSLTATEGDVTAGICVEPKTAGLTVAKVKIG